MGVKKEGVLEGTRETDSDQAHCWNTLAWEAATAIAQVRKLRLNKDTRPPQEAQPERNRIGQISSWLQTFMLKHVCPVCSSCAEGGGDTLVILQVCQSLDSHPRTWESLLQPSPCPPARTPSGRLLTPLLHPKQL